MDLRNILCARMETYYEMHQELVDFRTIVQHMWKITENHSKCKNSLRHYCEFV